MFNNKLGKLAGVALLTIFTGLGVTAQAAGPDKLRIGFVASLSGVQAPGAMTTTVPNYRLWAHDVNEAGGIYLSEYDKKVKIELIEVDDQSQQENAIRQVERLITKEEVDFVLPPWGTGFNMAVAPVFHKYGYPHLAVTAINEKIPQLAERWDNTAWFLGMPSEGSLALVELLTDMREAGEIGNKVAMMNVAHQFGVELVSQAKPALEKAGFDIVYETNYPINVQDLTAQIQEAKSHNPDIFLAFSYPPDSIMITELSIVNGFNPPFFYTAVGTAFPVYKKKFGEQANGVFGLGGWNPNAPGAQDYFERHVEVTGSEPDRWASLNTYASLQVLQQAIEQVGEIDHDEINEVIRNGEFETVLGPIEMEDGRLKELWWVGQWQDGQYRGVAPADMEGAVEPKLGKRDW